MSSPSLACDEKCSVAGGTAIERLILFTRFPVAGRTKTRLIPLLGPEGAASLQRRLTLRALRSAERLSRERGVQIEVQFDGSDEHAMTHWLGDRFVFCAQEGADLGQRMDAAAMKAFNEGCSRVVIIGTDCPQLGPEILEEAFVRLRKGAVVLGPATDGGYYLIGLKQPVPGIFERPTWGTSTVLADSLTVLKRAGIDAMLLKPLSDIDRPEDFPSWQHLAQGEEGSLRQISIIIPALNEERCIARSIQAAAQGNPAEILVVDGGSHDDTIRQTQRAGARVLVSRPGRARQMNAGASAAAGSVFLFLHADSLLPENFVSVVEFALSRPGTAAGAFRFALSDRFRGSSFLEWSTNLRSRVWQMPYGDQGLFVRRSLFEELGGYADMPILEDYEFVRRLRRSGRIFISTEPVVTSARRWQQLGTLRTTLLNKWILLAYRLGWPVETLARIYRRPCPGQKTR